MNIYREGEERETPSGEGEGEFEEVFQESSEATHKASDSEEDKDMFGKYQQL